MPADDEIRSRARAVWGPSTVEATDAAALKQLEVELQNQPDRVLAEARHALGDVIDQADLRAAIAQARRMTSNKDAVLHLRGVELGLYRADEVVPPDFAFPGMTAQIPIDPSIRRFETGPDAGNYLLHWLRARTATALRGGREKFRWAEDSRTNFVYELPAPNGQPMRVGLFADFGNGLYASRYVAKHLVTEAADATIHLGDVYYAGTEAEVATAYDDPFVTPLLARPFFAMNGNHEMYSGGKYYFEYLDRKRALPTGVQKQEGTYFCLRTAGYQLLGLDTAYWTDGRHSEGQLQEWLHARLREGRAEGRVNVLLSPNEPYHLNSVKYLGLGKRTDLFKDLQRELDEDLVDLWFWGNVHYNALYHPVPTKANFVGSCIGHGGYPYKRISRSDLQTVGFAKTAFVETAARFPKWTGLRQEMGNNGYCMLTLRADGVELTYKDWMQRTRCHVLLPRRANGVGLSGQIVTLENCVDGENDCRRLG